MGLLGDAWGMLPKEVKFLVALSIFLYAGATLLNVIVVAWNLLGVNALNAINGCLGGSNPEACIPAQDGLYIFGINFADYWTITVIVVFVPILLFAFKWYGVVLKKD